MLPTSSPTKLWAHPRCLNGSAALRAAMCKNSFRAPLTTNQPVSLQTLLQAFHSNSIREPRTAPSVRWGNEPIPFRIRKTGAKPLVVGILKKANPCEPLSRVAMPACFLFSSPWLQSPPPNFHCIWFFNSCKWSFNWPPWEEVNQWVIEYDWRSMSHIRLLFQTKASWQLTRWANESTTNLGYRKEKSISPVWKVHNHSRVSRITLATDLMW